MLGSIICRLCGRFRPHQAVLRPSKSVTAWRNVYLGGQRAFHCRGALLATKGEKEITKILTEKLSPSYIEVRDISGGCGSMYEIWIDSEQFSGKRLIQQHRMVNEALGETVVKSLHGLTVKIGNPKTGG